MTKKEAEKVERKLIKAGYQTGLIKQIRSHKHNDHYWGVEYRLDGWASSYITYDGEIRD